MSEINYKILLIGNSNVGKEIFFKKLSAGEYYEKSMSTVGIVKKTIDLDLGVIDKEGKSIKKNLLYLYSTINLKKNLDHLLMVI